MRNVRGSFNPLHLGHVRCMLSAARSCDRLIVVISHGLSRGEINVELRRRWVSEIIGHLPHVRLFVLEDPAPSKADYTGGMWCADAEKVRTFAGEPINAVRGLVTRSRLSRQAPGLAAEED